MRPARSASNFFAKGKGISAGRIHSAQGWMKTGAPGMSHPGDKQMVIYKHAISTIVPERPIPLCEPGEC